MITIGFTGTRKGMQREQWNTVSRILSILKDELIPSDRVVALHGDCVGADCDFDIIAEGYGFERVCRPCTFENMRARTGATEIEKPKPPMQRNRDIVADADVMIACPPNKTPIKSGSGTWATIGFARKAGKPLAIVFPDGTIQTERWPDSFSRGAST